MSCGINIIKYIDNVIRENQNNNSNDNKQKKIKFVNT